MPGNSLSDHIGMIFHIEELMIQHFVKEHPPLRFYSETEPRLCYMGKITPEISCYPRLLHSHGNHVEISIIYSGESQYLIRDQKYIIRRGDLLIYNSGIVHDELSNIHTQIGSYFFAIGNLQLPGFRKNALLPDESGPVFHAEEDFDRILQLCQTMVDGLENQGKWTSYISHFSMLALLEIIWHVINGSVRQEPQLDYYAGIRIKDYVDQYYREPLTLKTMAADLGLSESYISHVFKDMLGYTPMQYVLRRKIGEAQTLLISTEHSITEIAQMVGYDSQSHFNQRFRQYVGISPGKFRKNYKNYITSCTEKIIPPLSPKMQKS